MKPVYICYLDKEAFSHVVSDIEYIGATTFVDISGGIEARENDIIIFVGTDYRSYNEQRFIGTTIKEVCWDDLPATVYILNSLYDLSYIDTNFESYIEAMEYKKEPNSLCLFSKEGKLVQMLIPQFYKYMNPEQ